MPQNPDCCEMPSGTLAQKVCSCFPGLPSNRAVSDAAFSRHTHLTNANIHRGFATVLLMGRSVDRDPPPAPLRVQLGHRPSAECSVSRPMRNSEETHFSAQNYCRSFRPAPKFFLRATRRFRPSVTALLGHRLHPGCWGVHGNSAPA